MQKRYVLLLFNCTIANDIQRQKSIFVEIVEARWKPIKTLTFRTKPLNLPTAIPKKHIKHTSFLLLDQASITIDISVEKKCVLILLNSNHLNPWIRIIEHL